MVRQDPAQRCAICQGTTGALCWTSAIARDGLGFSCEACGKYDATDLARSDWLDYKTLTVRDRAALSHTIRTYDRGRGQPYLTTDWLDNFLADVRLPSVAVQAANLIRAIGDHQSDQGAGYFIDSVVDAPLVGSINRPMFDLLVAELRAKRLIMDVGGPEHRDIRGGVGVYSVTPVGLSLDGWERYEAERKGEFAGKYGFLAMKFGDPVLEAFATDVIKPQVQAAIGYDVLDLRNLAEAGIIDNIMRERIRDAAFVLVDLTHDNSGAYWEAGYAEGLGKPVIYLCEKTKFDQVKTHFDTNHCTTVTWVAGSADQFVLELVATLRRSLNLF